MDPLTLLDPHAWANAATTCVEHRRMLRQIRIPFSANLFPRGVAGFAGMSIEALERTYSQHHPDHQAQVGNAFSTGRAGRAKATN